MQIKEINSKTQKTYKHAIGKLFMNAENAYRITDSKERDKFKDVENV